MGGRAARQEAAESLGLLTVGDLLDHLPRESGEARTIAELVAERDGDGDRRGALDHGPAGAPAGDEAAASRRPSPTRPA